MKRKVTGRYVTVSTVGERCRAFIPAPLPPAPPLAVDSKLQEAIDRALHALGRLDSVSDLLPDTAVFLYMYVRKEAVLSSQIEGTQSSLDDLLAFEMDGAPGVPVEDVTDVSNYVAATEYGLNRLREGFPFSVRLIKDMHGVLLARGRGSGKTPGEFRRSQNWIGGSRPGNAVFVPPPPDMVAECMGDLEKFIHDKPDRTPALIKAAMAHAQFETIHPFLDGNGRVGRQLITLILCNEGVLKEPLLYLSLYFKTHRKRYYDLLQSVRTDGEWERWLAFFMDAVRETATQAFDTATDLVGLVDRDRERIRARGKAASSMLKVHQAILRHPVISVAKASETTGLRTSTVTDSLRRLVDMGIVKETTGRRRNRLFRYEEYVRVLNG